MLGAVWIVLAVVVLAVVQTGVTAAVARLVGLRLKEIKIFYGKGLSFDVAGTKLSLGFVPLGGSVSFDDATVATKHWQMIVTALAGVAGVLGVGLLLLGGAEGWRHFTNGFRQLLLGAVLPHTDGAAWVRTTYQAGLNFGFPAVLGVLACKQAALNVLPIPPTNGGQIGLRLLSLILPPVREFAENINLFGMLIVLAIYVGWVVAMFFAWLIQP